MAYKDSNYTVMHCCALTQPYDFGAETYLGDGVMSTFVFPLATIA